MEADGKGRWLQLTWTMPTGRTTEHYRSLLSDWKANVTALNADIIKEMQRRGADPVGAGMTTHKNGDVETFDLGGGVTLEMVYVEPGTFMMGSPMSEAGRRENEVQHRVTLTKGYWIGKYEVTQEQWGAIMGTNPATFKGAMNPVETVSWDDCKAFIEKLNMRSSGDTFRLPTEAEWEFAARGGNKSRGTVYSGGNELNAVGWYEGNSGRQAHEVGTKAPNELGIYDMSGNVWEWCSDWYGDYSVLAQVDPDGAKKGSIRVKRGGSWGNYADFCRVASRYHYAPSNSHDGYGFRLARSPGR
ncbi:MAG: formylglycine-generating enzyme family protein [Spartobacteria bacterium]|nr:formylglycine-generating enzyme family protein [Spartobacteria bacterium]